MLLHKYHVLHKPGLELLTHKALIWYFGSHIHGYVHCFDHLAPYAKSTSNTEEESIALSRYMNDSEISMIAHMLVESNGLALKSSPICLNCFKPCLITLLSSHSAGNVTLKLEIA